MVFKGISNLQEPVTDLMKAALNTPDASISGTHAHQGWKARALHHQPSQCRPQAIQPCQRTQSSAYRPTLSNATSSRPGKNVELQEVLAGIEDLIPERRAAVAEKLASSSRSRWFSEGDVGKA